MAVTRFEIQLKARIFNVASPLAGDDLLSTGITVNVNSGGISSTLRVYACFSNAGELSVTRTIGGVMLSEVLNGGSNLSAGCSYMFNVPIQLDTTINFRFSAGAGTTNVFIVDEVSSE